MATILVIEDEAAILDTIVDTLQAEKFDVHSAANGSLGIELARKHMPDLIICDVMMPLMDGFEVLRQLRDDPKTATIPFIFLTAKAERDDLRKGMELGADDYVSKPFMPKELLKAVGTRLKRQTDLVKKYEESLNELRKNIIYALPHELKTPLVSILGFAEMVKLDVETADPDHIRQMADNILVAGKRLHRLIENYLAYAQIEIMATDARQVDALRNHSITDPTTIAMTVAKQKAEEYERQSDLVLELYYGPVFRISESDFKKIIEELVDNAFKFSEAGSKVLLRSTQEDENFVLHFRDHGRGMSGEQLKSLGVYMQFERALYEQQGLGMGFTVAKRLVDIHGGRMKIKSDSQNGTLIQVGFPL